MSKAKNMVIGKVPIQIEDVENKARKSNDQAAVSFVPGTTGLPKTGLRQLLCSGIIIIPPMSISHDQ